MCKRNAVLVNKSYPTIKSNSSSRYRLLSWCPSEHVRLITGSPYLPLGDAHFTSMRFVRDDPGDLTSQSVLSPSKTEPKTSNPCNTRRKRIAASAILFFCALVRSFPYILIISLKVDSFPRGLGRRKVSPSLSTPPHTFHLTRGEHRIYLI